MYFCKRLFKLFCNCYGRDKYRVLLFLYRFHFCLCIRLINCH
uniref:Uncharacterized protein n=1 Tax=Anguilla anguilla TaxID=7936 RepID=A0A0E9QS89_ANGAN